MTYSLRFLPEVEEDVITSYSWYEEKGPGLGEEFLRMFYVGAGEIPGNPVLYPRVYGKFRRRVLLTQVRPGKGVMSNRDIMRLEELIDLQHSRTIRTTHSRTD